MGELESAAAIKAASSDESAASNTDSIERLNKVRDQIVPFARERCEGLRQAVARCDYFEQALCNCQSWCSHMHHILNLRISSDIHALDVPHEYKQAFESGTLFPVSQFSLLQQMDKEFAEYDNLIKELDEFIETSKSQWSSSERLRLQSEHAKTQLRDLRVKYNEFKQPVILGERMERLNRSLGDIECSIDDLVGIQAENCEYCLIHAKQLHRQLGEELAGDCRALESAKEALIREGIINETQAIEISQRISDLQEKCSQLEQRAALSIEKLERCVILLSKLEKEHREVEKLTQQVEEALVEAIASAKSIPSTPTTPAAHLREKGPAAVSTATLTILRQQLKSAVEAADKSKELEALLKQNSIRLSPAHCEKIASRDLRISTLKKQLSIWAETIQHYVIIFDIFSACVSMCANQREAYPEEITDIPIGGKRKRGRKQREGEALVVDE
uniref:Uncharacterized protein n=1 Tax=Ditylenchus dipsaci TaxID=166011 RepID=A0A915DTQ8_9BILA